MTISDTADPGRITSSNEGSPWLAPRSPDLVWFSGDDAVRFLNDLISQEIGSLSDGQVVRSLLLRPDGKLDHVLWVVRSGKKIGLITDAGRGEHLASNLARFRIRVDVEIAQEEDDVWLVMGEWEGIDISWPDTPRSLVVGARPELPPGTDDDYASARVESGEPSWGAELDESTIPHETSLVPWTIDFDKGCFLGQELVARMDSRGATAPRLVRWIELQGPVTPGADITVGGSSVGALTSVSGLLGMGLVHRSVEPGQTVDLGGTSGIVVEIPRKPKT